MSEFELVTLAAPLTAGTQDFVVSGFGTPKAAMLFMTPSTLYGTPGNQGMLSIGMVDGTTQYAFVTNSRDNVTPEDNYNVGSNSGCLLSMSPTTGAIDGKAAFSAWITNGLRINWTTPPPAAYLVTVLLIGGTGVANAKAVYAQTPSVINTGTTVTVGFPTTFMICVNTNQGASSTDTVDPSCGCLNVGIALSNGTQYSINFFDLDAVSPTQVALGFSNQAVDQQAVSGSGGPQVRVENFTGTGFDAVLRVLGGSVRWTYCLCIQLSGLSVALQPAASPTVAGNATYAGVGFTPQLAFMLLSSLTSYGGTPATDAAGEAFGVGLLTAANQISVAAASDDNVSPSNTEGVTDNRAVKLRKDGFNFLSATLTGFTSDGMTLNYATVDAAARNQAVLFVQQGTGPPPPTGPKLIIRAAP